MPRNLILRWVVLASLIFNGSVFADTTVVAWGRNDYNGQTNVPALWNDIVSVAGMDQGSLALRANGSVVSWGNLGVIYVSNAIAISACSYQWSALMADGTVRYYGSQNSGFSNIIAIAQGVSSTLALRSDGTVVETNYSATGSVPQDLSGVVAVAAGYQHRMALRANGTVVCWGGNSYGQTNVPANATSIVAIAAGYYHSLAVRSNGTVVAWGNDYYGQCTPPSAATNVVAVAAGENFSMALRADGSLVAWGTLRLYSDQSPHDYYAPATVPNGVTNVVAIAAGGNHAIAVMGTPAPFLNLLPLTAQTVGSGANATFSAGFSGSRPATFQWRFNGTNIVGAAASSLVLSNVSLAQSGVYSVTVSNAAGTASSSAQLTVTATPVISPQPQSQTVFAGMTAMLNAGATGEQPLSYQWRVNGTNLPGANANPLVFLNAQAAQSGNYALVASNAFGSAASDKARLTVVPVALWYTNLLNETNVPADLTNLVAASTGSSAVGLRNDGTVVAWNFGSTQSSAIGLSNIVSVSGGGGHYVALALDGSVFAWGANFSGQTNVPAAISNIVAVAAGGEHGLALRADGRVLGWGGNLYGQSYSGAELTNYVAIAAGSEFSVALRGDGTLNGWGVYYNGQSLVSASTMPADLTNIVAIATGPEHVLALRADGKVVAWGLNQNGQTNVPVGLNDVVAIAGGYSSSYALRADGSVVSWGAFTAPSQLPKVGAIDGGYSSYSLAIAPLGPPYIASCPIGRTQLGGTTTYFRVEASGARPLFYQWQHAAANIAGATNPVLQLDLITDAHAGAYTCIVSNQSGITATAPAILSLGQNTNQIALGDYLPWNTQATNGWFVETNETHDGVSAMQSGSITHSQSSELTSAVVGPGMLTFWWKVSSEPYYDFLEFYVDGVQQPGRISGEVPWTKYTNNIAAGTHTLRWRYTKDISDTIGLDTGWLDEVTFAPAQVVVPATPLELKTGAGGIILSSNGLALHLVGPTGIPVVIETSPDLLNWQPASTNVLPIDGLDLILPVGIEPQRFFRARVQNGFPPLPKQKRASLRTPL